MYRLGSSDELFDIGWDDYLARGGVCAVEWSERCLLYTSVFRQRNAQIRNACAVDSH